MRLFRDRRLFLVVSLSLLAVAIYSARTLLVERTDVLTAETQDSDADRNTQDASLVQRISGDTVETTSPNAISSAATQRLGIERTLESTFVIGSYFDVSAYDDASERGESFDLLVKELRNSSSPTALEASARYRELFYLGEKSLVVPLSWNH